MPPMPDPKVRLLFSVPLAAMAASLARVPDQGDTAMASAVPRVLAATFACAALAWVASSADVGKRGPWNFVGGLAMAGCAAMTLAFGASLCVAMATAGGFGLMEGLASAFALLMMGAAVLILTYVVTTITGIRAVPVAAVMACQIAPLTVLIFDARREAAFAVAAAASVLALHAALRLRAAGKK